MTETTTAVFENMAASGELMTWLTRQQDKAGPTAMAERVAAVLIAAKTPDLKQLGPEAIRDMRETLERARDNLAVRVELMNNALELWAKRTAPSLVQ